MECLYDYIGIEGCGAAPPPDNLDDFSGLVINQLPGINLEMMESLADDEQKSYLGVWDDVKSRSLIKFVLAVKAELNKCYKITDKTVVECLICENRANLAVSLWYLIGTELMIERTSSSRLNRFTTIDLDKAEKLKAEFYSEFQGALSDAISSMNPQASDCVEGCVECNESAVRWKEQTP